MPSDQEESRIEKDLVVQASDQSEKSLNGITLASTTSAANIESSTNVQVMLPATHLAKLLLIILK